MLRRLGLAEVPAFVTARPYVLTPVGSALDLGCTTGTLAPLLVEFGIDALVIFFAFADGLGVGLVAKVAP